MLKLLVLICGLVAVTVAKPGALLSPVVGRLVSEKTIESHGNSVIHSSAPLVSAAVPLQYTAAAVPVVQAAAAPVPAPAVAAVAVPVAPKAALVAEKTVEAHGHSVVHTAPAISYAAAIPVAAPLEVAAEPLVKVAVQPQKEAAKEEVEKPQVVLEKSSEPRVDAAVIQYSPIYHEPLAYAAPSPIYYSAYPALAPYEKTITSYGHTVFHHGA
ncbi:cuticle protein 16.5-like [Prorops nasuta]|uniref:cuticle protein 16.5-like n=1 Tax=Prorops nasuta TaxID=863751 RepID=UPI0034CED60C